jgi:hypothetical protein
MGERVISKELQERGFSKHGKSYLRVVGDGVFQHVLLGFKERLHFSAPGYSHTHRYEPRILVYLKSMYARYDDVYVSIDSTIGFRLSVPELLDKKDADFLGAAPEVERMINEGLNHLDAITTQKQIIEHLEPLEYIESEKRQRYSTQLYDMYLYCEEFYKARMAIETEFTHNYFACMSENDTTWFSEQLCRSYYERYMLTFPVYQEAARERLQRNYEINSCRLRNIGIKIE